MLSLVRQCRAFTPAKQFLGVSNRTLPKNGLVRTYMTPIWRRQPLTNLLKTRNFLKPSGAIIVRLNSNIPQKSKKSIGYWLMTCSGMVFVAVVLGITIIYYSILVSICTVLEEVIKKTVK